MINKVILVGRLGKDPEFRTFENGDMLATFPLATFETYKDKDGVKQEKTEWHNLVIWGKQAEIAQKFLHKGKLIYCEGKLTSRSYENPPGVKKYITEVRLESFRMLDSPVNAGSSTSNTGQEPQPVQPVPVQTHDSSPTQSAAPEGDNMPF
jgi:single-strand DNA-binding protein